jgi:hypothetical protein
MCLPRKISERFGLSDLVIFTGGGCHIFAKALFDLMPQEKYELRHLRAFHSGGEKPGYHVYLHKDGYAVDALGIKKEEDVIAAFMAKSGWTFKAEACDFGFLFNRTKEKEESGPLNEWDMYLHEDYVAYLEGKARLIIRDNPTRYSVQNLQSGLEILKNSKT